MADREIIDIKIQEDIASKKNILCIGPGGCGKSAIVNRIAKLLREKTVPFEILCPTGQSCIHVNGTTYHRFFPWKKSTFFGIKMTDLCNYNISNLCLAADVNSYKQKSYKSKIKSIQVLIFDEFSMISSIHFTCMDRICRLIKGSNLPFGGIQIMAFGDPFQLPPVMDKFPFYSPVWNTLEFSVHNIGASKLYRYRDQEFSDITRIIRLGILPKYVLDKLQARQIEPKNKTTEIYYENSDADMSNITEYNNLFGTEYTYGSSISIRCSLICKESTIKKDFIIDVDQVDNALLIPAEVSSSQQHGKEIETSMNEWFKFYLKDIERIYGKNYMYPKLKTGTRIICTRNHKDGLYYNGTTGIIKECFPDSIQLLTTNDNSSIKIEYVQPEDTYTFDLKTHSLVVRVIFRHIPVRLGYAITYNRSQGMTIDSVKISGKGLIRKPGLVYVGISRCKSLDDLYLDNIKFEKISASYDVINKFRNHYIGELTHIYQAHPDWLEQYTVELSNSEGTKNICGVIEMIVLTRLNLNPMFPSSSTESVCLTTNRGGSQALLRKILLEMEGKCLLTGEKIPDILEAAHIKNYCEFSDSSKAHIGNGILLRCDLHTLFDKGYFAIDEEGTVVQSESFSKHPVYSGIKKISIPSYVNKEYLKWRLDNIFVQDK